MRIQVWTSNYDPEPQGIGPLTTTMSEHLLARGHDVLVVTAHPHYPEPAWGVRARPYRERRRGVPVLRLPLWVGRDTGRQRIRQEVTYTLAQSATAALLPPCDVIVAVSPSLAALAPCMAVSRLRRTPWVLWLQDIVTDGAISTGLLQPGGLARAAQRFERATYAEASRIVVISESFRRDLLGKGVPDHKIVRIYNTATHPAIGPGDGRRPARPPRILAMGNIGHSQGLDRIVDAFEASAALTRWDARLIIAGHGVEAPNVRARIRSDRVLLTGVLDDDALAHELRQATVGLVSQRADVAEFNLPSKVMNYMAQGVPVLASVRPGSETARIVEESGAGWVSDSQRPEEFAQTAARVLGDEADLARASEAGRRYALEHFRPETASARFEAVLSDVVSRSG